jgi:hypothetical protein
MAVGVRPASDVAVDPLLCREINQVLGMRYKPQILFPSGSRKYAK